MKKLLLTLVIALSFGTAIADKNVATEAFLSKKAPVTLGLMLAGGNAHINAPYQCEQDCWDTKTMCLSSGQNFSVCIQALMQCIDTCEGAGGLYQ